VQSRFAGGRRREDKPMEHRADEPKNSGSTTAAVRSHPAEPAKFQLPIDFDDIVAVAILDSVLRLKRRRSRSRSTTRRPK
jgi:hypothetical protein